MEEKLVELLIVLNKLNESQEKIFGEFDYTADDSRKLEIAIRRKGDFKYVERTNISLTNYPVEKLEAIINIFKNYAGGKENE